MLEDDGLLRELVEVGRLHVLVPVEAEMVGAQRVEAEDDDVGGCREGKFVGGGSAAGERECDEGRARELECTKPSQAGPAPLCVEADWIESPMSGFVKTQRKCPICPTLQAAAPTAGEGRCPALPTPPGNGDRVAEIRGVRPWRS